MANLLYITLFPGTSIQYERPKCRSKVKRKRSRRGKKPRRNKGPRRKGQTSAGSRKQGGEGGRKHACIQADRSEFNTQVADIIISDYRKAHGRVPEGTMDHRREMIGWKFDQMDVDRNGE